MTMTAERLAELRDMFDAADRQDTYWLKNVLSANVLAELGAADVRAALDHIDAQAATIARLVDALRTAEAFIHDHGDGIGHTDFDCPCGEASARRKARAALTGAA